MHRIDRPRICRFIVVIAAVLIDLNHSGGVRNREQLRGVGAVIAAGNDDLAAVLKLKVRFDLIGFPRSVCESARGRIQDDAVLLDRGQRIGVVKRNFTVQGIDVVGISRSDAKVSPATRSCSERTRAYASGKRNRKSRRLRAAEPRAAEFKLFRLSFEFIVTENPLSNKRKIHIFR